MKTSTKIWMGITGVLLVILGVICIIYPGATLLSTSTVLGILTLASGISTFISWTRIKYYLPTGNMLLSSILQIILGIFFLNHKLLTASTLPIVFACWLFIEGIILSIRHLISKTLNSNPGRYSWFSESLQLSSVCIPSYIRSMLLKLWWLMLSELVSFLLALWTLLPCLESTNWRNGPLNGLKINSIRYSYRHFSFWRFWPRTLAENVRSVVYTFNEK